MSNESDSLWRDPLRFVLHLAVVYLGVWYCTPGLSHILHDWIEPRLGGTSDSSFQYLYSHALALCAVPAILMGLFNARYRHRVAQYVWIVPAVLLVYHIVTFPSTIFQNRYAVALRYYFTPVQGVPEFHNLHELFTRVMTSSEANRGLHQQNTGGPLWAAIAYSIATWAGIRSLEKKANLKGDHADHVAEAATAS